MAAQAIIVLLAAGTSSRMRGTDKLLEQVEDRPLLTLMAERCAKVAQTRVVLGPGQPERRAVLADLDVKIVEATDTDGMAASIRAGVGGLTGTTIMIVLADMPEIMAADLHLLLSLHAQRVAPIVQAAGSDGTPGQPVVFSSKYLKSLSKLTGDHGAKSILAAHPGDVTRIPLPDQRATTDLDTPEDWAAWRGKP